MNKRGINSTPLGLRQTLKRASIRDNSIVKEPSSSLQEARQEFNKG